MQRVTASHGSLQYPPVLSPFFSLFIHSLSLLLSPSLFLPLLGLIAGIPQNRQGSIKARRVIPVSISAIALRRNFGARSGAQFAPRGASSPYYG